MAETLVNKNQLGVDVYDSTNLIPGTNISFTDVTSYGGCFSFWNNKDSLTNIIPGGPYFPSASVYPSNQNYMQSWTGYLYDSDSKIGIGDYTLQVHSGEDGGGTTKIGATSSSSGFYQTENNIYVLKDISQSASGNNIIATVSSTIWSVRQLLVSRKEGTCYFYIDGTYLGSFVDNTNVTNFCYVYQNSLGTKNNWLLWNVANHADGQDYTAEFIYPQDILDLATTIKKVDCEVPTTSVVTLTTSSTELATNTIYNGGTLASVTITLPATVPVDFISQVEFSSGSTATTFTAPAGLYFMGDATEGGVFTPAASHRYCIMVMSDGSGVIGLVVEK